MKERGVTPDRPRVAGTLSSPGAAPAGGSAGGTTGTAADRTPRGARLLGLASAACIGTAIVIMIFVDAPAGAGRRCSRPASRRASALVDPAEPVGHHRHPRALAGRGRRRGRGGRRGDRGRPRRPAAVPGPGRRGHPGHRGLHRAARGGHDRSVRLRGLRPDRDAGPQPLPDVAYQLGRIGDPVGKAAPHAWRTAVSDYGPVACLEQAAAAELGGGSAARIIFWLKLWNALAFGAVAILLDRLLRGDAARRTRAHLWWTLNPLLLWGLVASGHVDGFGTAIGFCGLILLRPGQPGERPSPTRVAAAAALVGVAADVKITSRCMAWASPGRCASPRLGWPPRPRRRWPCWPCRTCGSAGRRFPC